MLHSLWHDCMRLPRPLCMQWDRDAAMLTTSKVEQDPGHKCMAPCISVRASLIAVVGRLRELALEGNIGHQRVQMVDVRLLLPPINFGSQWFGSQCLLGMHS